MNFLNEATQWTNFYELKVHLWVMLWEDVQRKRKKTTSTTYEASEQSLLRAKLQHTLRFQWASRLPFFKAVLTMLIFIGPWSRLVYFSREAINACTWCYTMNSALCWWYRKKNKSKPKHFYMLKWMCLSVFVMTIWFHTEMMSYSSDVNKMYKIFLVTLYIRWP